MLGINFYIITLPSMPTVPSGWLSQHGSELEDGTPPFLYCFLGIDCAKGASGEEVVQTHIDPSFDLRNRGSTFP